MKNVISKYSNQIKPADSWDRFWAFTLDSTIFFSIPDTILLVLNTYYPGAFLDSSYTSIARFPALMIISSVLFILYNVYFIANKGATIGKMCMD